MTVVVTGLYVYPVKSCGGIALDVAQLDARGIRFDRQWMFVDKDGTFLTQRDFPKLALVRTAFNGDNLVLSAPHVRDLCVPLAQREDADVLPVVIWRDMCLAVDEGGLASEWVSQFLDCPVRLVRMADDFVRPVDPKYANTPAQ
ncbi:MAG: MOSC domain-containing protein, partial [Anaerolineae bacterium]|nr:MOSC domain-containing protein [Anaerolineae bacterium]